MNEKHPIGIVTNSTVREALEQERRFFLDEFKRMCCNDVTASSIMKATGTLSTDMASVATLRRMVVTLWREKERLFGEVSKLSAIAPRKITLPDGKVMVWHCPDHLIPDSATP